MPAKKPRSAPEPGSPEPIDPWSCATCLAPGLQHAFRIKGQSFCWDCFFERPGRETATFITHKEARS